ncbi:MAG: hypothetical protein KAV82_16060 [Phycisphaerae bacterium]|nr:hypothetical protein [Phycisphaerae bacterium]
MIIPRWSLLAGGAVVCALCGTAPASSISFSLANPGSDTVQSGTEVTLRVEATFDTRLSAVAFALSASGDTALTLVDRSLNPTGANGLTYVSLTWQEPFEENLPHDLIASSITEVAVDNEFDMAPGGASDGLPPGSGVLLEEITVKPLGVGTVTVLLSNIAAAHTTGPPDGALFDIADIGSGSVVLTVTSPPGDFDGDGDVDLADLANFVGCMTGPDNGPVDPPACNTFDFDWDNDVDTDDFGGFQSGFTGSF